MNPSIINNLYKSINAQVSKKIGATNIRIGVVTSSEGVTSANETMVAAAILLAVKDINNSTEDLPNHSLTVVPLNCKSDPDITMAEVVHSFVNTYPQQPHYVFGTWTSACRKSAIAALSEKNGLLFYPVQYEGLEDTKHMIATGSVPCQQIYPAIKWFLDGYIKSTTTTVKIFIVGVDYIYPHAIRYLIESYIESYVEDFFKVHARQIHIAIDSDFIPYERGDDDNIARSCARAWEMVAGQKSDLVINLINGISNRDFYKQRYDAIYPDLMETTTLSFSITPVDLLNNDIDELYLSEWFGPRDYLITNYFDPGKTSRLCFANKFNTEYKSAVITTDAMWNAYASVYLFAQAIDATQSTDKEILKQHFNLNGGTVKCGDDYLELVPYLCHPYKSLTIGQILATSPGLAPTIEIASKADGHEKIKPVLFTPRTTQDEAKAFTKLLWFVIDSFKNSSFPYKVEMRDYLFKQGVLKSPFLGRKSWAQFREQKDSQQKMVECFAPINDLAHTLGTFRDYINPGHEKHASLIAAASNAWEKITNLYLTDDDIYAARPHHFASMALGSVAKVKALAQREERLHLFDLLHYTAVVLHHKLFIEGKAIHLRREERVSNPEAYRTARNGILNDISIVIQHGLHWEMKTEHAVANIFRKLAYTHDTGEPADIEHHVMIDESSDEYVLLLYTIVFRGEQSKAAPLFDNILIPSQNHNMREYVQVVRMLTADDDANENITYDSTRVYQESLWQEDLKKEPRCSLAVYTRPSLTIIGTRVFELNNFRR